MPPVLLLVNELKCEFCKHSLFYDAIEFKQMVDAHSAWEERGCPACGMKSSYG